MDELEEPFLKIIHNELDSIIMNTFGIKNEYIRMEFTHFKSALFMYETEDTEDKHVSVILDEEPDNIISKKKTYMLIDMDDNLIVHGAALKNSGRSKLYSDIVKTVGETYMRRDLVYSEDVEPYYDIEKIPLEYVIKSADIKPPSEYARNTLQKQLGVAYEQQFNETIQGRTNVRYVKCVPQDAKRKGKNDYYIVTDEVKPSQIPRLDLEDIYDTVDKALEAITLFKYTRKGRELSSQQTLPIERPENKGVTVKRVSKKKKPESDTLKNSKQITLF